MPVRVLDNSPPSQTFAGTLNVSILQKDEAWRINISIQGYDLEHGYLSGTMEALNVPLADTPATAIIASLKSPQWDKLKCLDFFRPGDDVNTDNPPVTSRSRMSWMEPISEA